MAEPISHPTDSGARSCPLWRKELPLPPPPREEKKNRRKTTEKKKEKKKAQSSVGPGAGFGARARQTLRYPPAAACQAPAVRGTPGRVGKRGGGKGHPPFRGWLKICQIPFLLTWHPWGGWKIHFLLKGAPVCRHVSWRDGTDSNISPGMEPQGTVGCFAARLSGSAVAVGLLVVLGLLGHSWLLGRCIF